tara:strand:- start:575 stop:1039 length:465 start_codon:yes stop_codon:yes gene_type:complete
MTKIIMKKAPNFLLKSTNGKIIELNKVKSKFIVLYFYPKDDTPGCTIETKDFNSLLSKFKRLNCTIYGISKDNIESHKKFKKKYNVKFDLLADVEKKAIKSYKVWGKKKFLGKEFMGLIRSTFVIKQKKILKEWRSVKVLGHAKEVLSFLVAEK